jgi:hypothetical protein
MTTPYTPSATRHDTITTITDNDTPSGALFSTPLEELADNIAVAAQIARVGTTSAVKDGSELFVLTLDGDAGYTLEATDTLLRVPAAGRYEINWSMSIKSTDATNPLPLTGVVLIEGSIDFDEGYTTRFSGTAAHYVHTGGAFFVDITTPASQRLGAWVVGADGLTVRLSMSVRRIY